MKCSEFEKGIYLYNELTQRERQEIDAHVSTCAHCTQVVNNVRELHKVVALQQSETTSLRNHAAMTRGIVDAIGGMQRKSRPLFIRLLDWYLRQVQGPAAINVRNHMAVISLALVIFFMMEYKGGVEEPKIVKQYRAAAGSETELHVASFHTVFLEAKKKSKHASISIYDCVANCVGARPLDCKACADKFGNAEQKQYENP